jgi:glutathione synthase/RimK-type ligase-like ATP-grasp enzyme
LNPKCIGFLYLGETHTEYTDIARCLAGQGIESRIIDLTDCQSIQWEDYSLINVRECRGYHRHPDFLPIIDGLENQLGTVPMTNSFVVIRAAIDKANYLRELELSGADLIPTVWLQRGESITVEEIIKNTGWQDFVIKPTVSSKSWNTYRVVANGNELKVVKADKNMSYQNSKANNVVADLIEYHDVCIQQFMPEIFSCGELSFVFIDNEFSHAIRKTVASDNWVAHEFFGGKNEYYQATKSEVIWANHIFTLLNQKYGDFLYARIDAIPDKQRLLLLECELMVPRLFLKEGHALESFVQAMKKRLEKSG